MSGAPTRAPRWPGVVGAVAGGLAVAAGAFGAHALGDVLPAGRLATFETAVRYQMFHALALLVWQALLTRGTPPPAATLAAGLWTAGTLLFCGSLYALVGSGVGAWGAVAPVGGAALVAGWATAAWALARRRAA